MPPPRAPDPSSQPSRYHGSLGVGSSLDLALCGWGCGPFVSIPPRSVSWSCTLSQSVNQSISHVNLIMSISSYASDSSAASNPHSYEFSLLSDPSRQSGMVQPVARRQ
eukprot:scaffold739_cov101-Isochrysis_galbana.AAC.1